MAKKDIKILKIKRKFQLKRLNNFSPNRRLPNMKKLLRDIDFELCSSFDINLYKTVSWYKTNFKKVQMKTKIIAEAGVNHNGKISLAKKMISAAAKFGADYIKFQAYDVNELFT